MARSGGKKIQTWQYSHDRVQIEVPVHMHTGDKTTFQVRMHDLDINETDVSIDNLKKTVFALLKDKLAVEWRPILIVEIASDRDRLFEKKKKANTPDTDRSGSAELLISWTRARIGMLRGKKIHQEFENYWSGFHGSKGEEHWRHTEDGWPESGRNKEGTGRRRFRDDKESFTAVIDDTPENRIALEAIADDLEELSKRLMKLLNVPDPAQALLSLAANRLVGLPAPEKKPEKKPKKASPKSAGAQDEYLDHIMDRVNKD